MADHTLKMPDGRTVGYCDYGEPGGVPVLWCHGGPGSRKEPAGAAAGVADASLDLRLIGIDRPGYGLSTPQPGRTIGGWCSDALAVADALGLGRFLTAGISTGGGYALALAANAPERVAGVVASCANTDMHHAPAAEGMPGVWNHDVWNAPDREAAISLTQDRFGEDGSKMLGLFTDLSKADMAVLADPAMLANAEANRRENFAFGVQGFVDDRIADGPHGPGWRSFDVGAIECPVILVHGGEDTLIPVFMAHHTASLIPHADLRIYDELGHISIIPQTLMALNDLARHF
ncbi:MAG: alpha/beta hydrolase [Erythrobacter sp.]|uniref:alpha/beta fold hydrolase n=1 Tax=Erythrobacter sp. TaxID=1042 RepID=UPI00262FB694|nr:alpha/beta hydrolase [Erythrobacter sp.]MDJ0977306.1 alpha/beta hydrolase [Erythrobacter sp.]